MSYIQSIFQIGATYAARVNFTSGPTSQFIEGEKLVFQKNTYSPYDDCFVYEFKELSTGEIKNWWLADGKPKEEWGKYFVRV